MGKKHTIHSVKGKYVDFFVLQIQKVLKDKLRTLNWHKAETTQS
jgi:hypothetical protein